MHLAIFHGHKLNHTVPQLSNIQVHNVLWKDYSCNKQKNCIGDDQILKNYKPFYVKDRNWHWINCDAGILTFMKLHPELFSQHDYIWFFEWDARWSKDLNTILNAYQADSSDLLCPHLNKNDPWFHASRRDKQKYPNYAHCEQSVVRVSTRLLKYAFVDMKRYAMFCELRLASICLLHKWCTMRDLTYRNNFIGFPFRWPHVTNMSYLQQQTRPLLFHRVKTL